MGVVKAEADPGFDLTGVRGPCQLGGGVILKNLSTILNDHVDHMVSHVYRDNFFERVDRFSR